MSSRPLPVPPAGRALRLHLAGWLLFLFIPLVLFLFVRHPRPLAASLAAGVVLMLGHRFLARPFLARVRPLRCVWCSRWLVHCVAAPAPCLAALCAPGGVAPPRKTPSIPASARLARGADRSPVKAPYLRRSTLSEDGERQEPAGEVTLEERGGPLILLTCARHELPARRFFSLLDRFRLPLAAAIFLPLLALLAALAVAAAVPSPAAEGRLATATAVFQLAVGLAVNAAAWGYLGMRPAGRIRPAFPVHNFYLLGVRNLLWVFRLVGVVWIVQGLRFLLS